MGEEMNNPKISQEDRARAEKIASNILGYDPPYKYSDAGRQILEAIADARADEREACAKVAETPMGKRKRKISMLRRRNYAE